MTKKTKLHRVSLNSTVTILILNHFLITTTCTGPRKLICTGIFISWISKLPRDAQPKPEFRKGGAFCGFEFACGDMIPQCCFKKTQEFATN